MSRMDRFLDELEALPEEQRAGVFPLVVLMFAERLGSVPPPLQVSIDEFIEALGWRENDDDEARTKSAEAWLTRHGVGPEVWRRLLVALHEDPDAARAAAARLAGTPASVGALERKAPPPDGTVAAGPFARFRAQKIEPKT
jgi:hypothetical protein